MKEYFFGTLGAMNESKRFFQTADNSLFKGETSNMFWATITAIRSSTVMLMIMILSSGRRSIIRRERRGLVSITVVTGHGAALFFLQKQNKMQFVYISLTVIKQRVD
jgi:hypothetical protein